MNQEWTVYLAAAAVLLALVAFLIGRRTGGNARRQRALEDELAHEREDRSNLQSELEGVRTELASAREEHEAYRLDVVDHFSGTSDLLRDLTVQYRSVYEHLTQGASTLCPEGFVGLTEGLPKLELPGPDREVEDDAAAAASDEAPASDEASASDESPASDESTPVTRDPDEHTRPLSV